MTKTLMGLLLAATAMVPGIAAAQDEGPRPDMRQVRERALRQPDDGDRPQRRPDQARPDQGPQASGDRGGWRGGARQGFDGPRPDRAENRPQQPPVDGPRPAAQGDRPDWRGDRGDGRRDRDDARPGAAGWQNGSGRANGGNWRDGRGRPDDRGDGRTWRDDGNRPGDRAAQRQAYDRARAQQWNRNGADWRDNDRGRNGFDDRRSWNRGWRSDTRYDWNGYRAQNRGRYRLPRYYAPQGWGNGYRRFSVGLRLESILFNQNYWIQDPWTYRLPEAYGPYRWVRYYDDALLVDLNSGRVIDTVYGIFW